MTEIPTKLKIISLVIDAEPNFKVPDVATTFPTTTVVINSPAPNILPIASKTPSSSLDATNAVSASGDPLAKATKVTPASVSESRKYFAIYASDGAK